MNLQSYFSIHGTLKEFQVRAKNLRRRYYQTMNKNDRGIIYCRVSSLGQVRGTSLEGQEEACLDYAQRNNIEVANIYIEKGESATAANRTEFLKAIEFCQLHKNKVSAFIVWKIDRFARNTTDHFAVRAKLKKHGVQLHSVTEPITGDHMGSFIETLFAAVAELENEVRKQRCQGGMRRKIAEGIWCWQPPVGYIHAKKLTDRRKTRPDEPDPDRFGLIQKALKTYAEGNYNITGLAALMNEWGYKTRTGLPIGKQKVEKILTNKFYAGILVNPWDGSEHAGLHIPMITPEEFNQIQLVKQKFSRGADRPRLKENPDFPLRRFIRCICEKPYTGAWRAGRKKRYAYYQCHNNRCVHNALGIRKKNLEDGFKKYLNDISPNKKSLTLLESVMLDAWDNRHKTKTKIHTQKNNKLESLKQKKNHILQMRVDNEIGKDEFLKLRSSIEIQIAEQSPKDPQGTPTMEMGGIEKMLRETLYSLEHLAEQWEEIKETKQKQRFQRWVLPEGARHHRSDNSYYTAVMSPVIRLSHEFVGHESLIVAGEGIGHRSHFCRHKNEAATPPRIPHYYSGYAPACNIPTKTINCLLPFQQTQRKRCPNGHLFL